MENQMETIRIIGNSIGVLWELYRDYMGVILG